MSLAGDSASPQFKPLRVTSLQPVCHILDYAFNLPNRELCMRPLPHTVNVHAVAHSIESRGLQKGSLNKQEKTCQMGSGSVPLQLNACSCALKQEPLAT